MDSKERKTLHLKAKLPELGRLKDLNVELTTIHRDTVVRKYRKILDLLFIVVQTKFIIVLVQFYDPLLRSFLFQDFHLTPTLDEFYKILDLPLK